jgi:hypothetical protein
MTEKCGSKPQLGNEKIHTAQPLTRKLQPELFFLNSAQLLGRAFLFRHVDEA